MRAMKPEVSAKISLPFIGKVLIVFAGEISLAASVSANSLEGSDHARLCFLCWQGCLNAPADQFGDTAAQGGGGGLELPINTLLDLDLSSDHANMLA